MSLHYTQSNMDKLAGRTYSLPTMWVPEDGEYYLYILEQVDRLSAKVGGLCPLDKLLAKLVAKGSPFKRKHGEFEAVFARISSRLLAVYTPSLPSFLASLSFKNRNNDILGVSVRGYHLRMLHIEVLNRLMKNDFLKAEHKVVILPHCLRDFREDECQFQPSDVDYVCLGCTKECQINQTRMFLGDYPDYHLYVSQIQDLKKIFKRARRRYKNIGLLGVACIPELYEGMTLARRMGIPAQGVPLNYNRCSRWMGTAHYTNFNLGQLKKAIILD